MKLIKEVNEIKPFAFYLVDTLGILYPNDMKRFYYLIDNNLDENIIIGFHSHNNLQLSFSNAQEMTQLNRKRKLIIDSSVYGMGRGVGNLATELFADYINNYIEQRYSIIPLLDITDKYLLPIYSQQKWGYALPYFISASVKCHPNYASYLIKKETLSIERIEKILSLIRIEDRAEYNEQLIETLYFNMQKCTIDDSNTIKQLQKLIQEKNILILGPGNSIEVYKEKIKQEIEQHKFFIVSIHFINDMFPLNAVFFSNEKRVNLNKKHNKNIIHLITSNLNSKDFHSPLILDYASLLGEGASSDNALAMLIRLFKKIGVKKIFLAGFDGFDINPSLNYFISSYKNELDFETVKKKNDEISKQLISSLKGIEYEFITPTKYKL